MLLNAQSQAREQRNSQIPYTEYFKGSFKTQQTGMN